MPIPVLALVLVPFLIVAVLAMIFLTPSINGLFAFIWEDPTNRLRRKILYRLRQIHNEGNIPDQTAVLMVASEFHTTEHEVLDTVGVFSAEEIKGIFTEQRGLLGILADKLRCHLRAGAGTKGGKPHD